jgi:hypothetical protein
MGEGKLEGAMKKPIDPKVAAIPLRPIAVSDLGRYAQRSYYE